jgi:hypothetical protein
MEPIKDTISSLMQEWGTKKRRTLTDDPWVLLKKALTKKELRHIKFNYFRKGVLGLYVDSSGWLYALSLQKQNLLSKLSVKSCAIKDIRFRLGELK